MPNEEEDDCKRTIRTARGRIRVAAGQHLHYFVTVAGQRGVFTLSCAHKTHFRASDFGPPKQNYDIVWERSQADEGPNDDGDDYTFSMSFITALMYTVVVELHDAAHDIVGDGLVLDADYESDNSEMFCNESWVVRTKP